MAKIQVWLADSSPGDAASLEFDGATSAQNNGGFLTIFRHVDGQLDVAMGTIAPGWVLYRLVEDPPAEVPPVEPSAEDDQPEETSETLPPEDAPASE